MSAKIEETDNFEELLRQFQTLLPLNKTPKTYLEISGFPKRELACSNILGFFLDPSEEHGFGNVLLKSIFEAAQKKSDGCFESDPGRSGALEITRESRTDENKSIDIVIEGKEFVLGIENKLFAPTSKNPFALYAKKLQDLSSGRRCHKILLSVRRENTEGKCGFIPIIYDDVFLQLEKNLGTKILNADQRCMAFLIDFINTIKNLKSGTHMDPKLLNFFANNEGAIHDLYTQTQSLIEELKMKGKEVQKLVGEIKLQRISNWQEKDDSSTKDRADCAYCIWCMGDLGDGRKVGIELYIRASGWRILLWPDGDEAETTLADFAKKSGIRLNSKYESKTRIWVHDDTLLYDADPASVATKFKDFVHLMSEKLMAFQNQKA